MLAVVAACAANQAWPQTYAYFTFDPPNPTTYFVVAGMNNSGQIVVRDATRSYVRGAGTTAYITIEVPGATQTTATAINNPGQIAGIYNDSSGTHSFLRSADGKTYTTFDIPGGGASQYGSPLAINDKGEMTGASYSAGPVSYGFLRSADGKVYTNIQVPDASATYPLSINNNGEIVGWCIFGGSYGLRHGFLREPDGTYRLVDLPGTIAGTQAAAINNQGQIAIYVPGGFVLNPDGTSAAIDPLGGGAPAAIDDNGRVAGVSFADGGYHGFLAVPAAAGAQPAIRTRLGVVSASGFGGFEAIAPGSWVEIYGSNLAKTTRPWQASDFNGNAAPTMLDDVTVTINGRRAFISYISPGQVNAQAPSTLMPGPAQVVVSNSAGTSAGYSTTIVALQPGLLNTAGSTYFAVAVFPDYSGLVNASRPAKRGETIVLYGTGFGPVIPAVPAGQIATGASSLAGQLQIFFDGVPAQVTYAGLAPGAVGLYQFNVVVPDGVTVPGDVPYRQVPLTFTLNGAAGTQTLSTLVAP
jgi:uncharacterized protein (TIGR03437 family)